MIPQRAQLDIDDGNIYFEEIARPAPDLGRNQYDIFAGMPELWDYRKLSRRTRSRPVPKEQGRLFSEATV